jgi:alpha-tubulin suppressor-like RCC1 family protein
VAVSGLDSGVSALAGGYGHTCALVTGGGAKCWGLNSPPFGNGQLGDGTSTDRTTPVDVVGLASGVSTITLGGHHTCALAGGGVKCWGFNPQGQLGDGTTNDHPTPVDVPGLTSGVVAVAAGGHFTCAIVGGGGVKCWGDNSNGQLGDGTISERHTPVSVTGLGGVSSLAASGHHLGGFFVCAIVGGGAKCWGDNGHGQLGNGTTTESHSPVAVSGLSSGVVALAAGGNFACALLSSGGVKCWGANEHGELGDGSTNDRSTPGDVVGLTRGVSAIAAGSYHTCAVLTTGEVRCWGRNDLGQLGDGTKTDRTTPVTVLSAAAVSCHVPNVRGKTLRAAKKAIARRHCSVGKIRRAFSAKFKKGRVVSQKPRPGKVLPEHGKVNLVVSRGKRR